MDGRALGSLVDLRDLGVEIRTSLKVASQVDRVVKNAFDTSIFICRGIEHRGWDGFTPAWDELLQRCVSTFDSKQHLPYTEVGTMCHRCLTRC